MVYRTRNAQIIIIFFFALFLSGCASLGPYTINLADPPEFFVQNNINPLENAPLLEESVVPIFYATNREPWGDEKAKYSFYKNQRSRSLNVGKAMVRFGKKGTTWTELKEFIDTKKKRQNYSLKVLSVDEFGELNHARQIFDPRRNNPENAAADRRLIKEINNKLTKSENKNITIFVHGFKVPFEDPVLVISQIGFYDGFDGVVMGFSWPSSQKMFGYLADVEQTQYAARFLGFLLQFLATSTNVEKINIIAHSAGTRVLSRALTDISLLGGRGPDRQDIIKSFKIGNVVFAGGDLSRDVMGVYIEYKMIEVPSKVIIYFSSTDKALGLSHWLWNVGRIGDFDFDDAKITDYAIDYFKSLPLELVDATGTPGSTKNFGHIYFLDSHWVSSDLMIFLRTNLSPEDRGLVLEDNGIIWKFPKDYKTRTIYQKLKNRIPGASIIPGTAIIEDTLKLK